MLQMKNLNIRILISAILFWLVPFISMAQESHDSLSVATTESVESAEFDAGRMIMDHISDAHGWHLWGESEIPLPIIVYSPERGLSVFSSGHFHHGHSTYNGYMLKEQKL